MPWTAERINISIEESIDFQYCIADMQYKSLFLWIFNNIGQFCCPKNTFMHIYTVIKPGNKKKNDR